MPCLSLDTIADVRFLQYVLHYIPQGKDGKAGPAGQVYVILSTADGNTVQAADENTVAGVGILEL